MGVNLWLLMYGWQCVGVDELVLRQMNITVID